MGHVLRELEADSPCWLIIAVGVGVLFCDLWSVGM